jgi:hypothetical protein
MLVSVPPALAAVVLAAPCLGYSFLYDDYDFLYSVHSHRLVDLLPDPRSLFYRPLSREAWFGAISLLHLDRPMVFHVLNALLLALAVILLASLANRLAGPRAAVIAGFTFAGLGSMPILVGWAAGVQDILAIDLLLGAILLRLARRDLLAVLAAAAAILSKETAVAVIPVLASLRWLLERRRFSLKSDVAPYALLLLLWLLMHPGVHILLQRRFAANTGGYLGLDQPDRTAAVVKSMLTLANIPVAEVALGAIGFRWIGLAVACGLIWIALPRVEPRSPMGGHGVPVTTGRLLVLSGLLAILPMTVTLALVRLWEPYYSCIPALGTSLVAGALLRSQRTAAISVFLIGFMTLGVLARAAELDPSITAEMTFERTSRSLQRVEAGFKRLYPSLPPGSSLYVSAQVHGIEGVYTHMYRFQALREWYHEPSLITAKPQAQRTGSEHEYLFWIEPNLDIGEIELSTLRPRSSGARPEYLRYQKTVRGYAFGLAGSGQSIRAAQTLLRMPEPNALLWGLDARIAAMFLLADGKEAYARDLLAHVPTMSREDALGALSGVLADLPPGRDWDDAGLEAFGIRSDDIGADRQLMKWFATYGYERSATRFAQRILRDLPADPEATALITASARKQAGDRVTTFSSPDSL